MSSSMRVADEAERERFLRDEVPGALARLDASTRARWGGMSAQEMVEHLLWAFEGSTGRIAVECPAPEEELARYRPFLYSDAPTPRSFMNPLLTRGLPTLRFASFEEARSALLAEVSAFLDEPVDGAPPRTHPVFGPLDREQWHRAHYKHAWHHLEQFGVLDRERPTEP